MTIAILISQMIRSLRKAPKLLTMVITYLIILLLIEISYSQTTENCMVTYTQQPPTDLSCNPYPTHLDPPVIFVRYGCQAVSTVPLEDFKITWYRESLDGKIENLGCPVVHLNYSTQQRCLLDILGETEPGMYWCVASYTVEGEIRTLERSNVGHIERATAYVGLPQCDGANLDEVSRCGDNPIVTTTTQTTLSTETITSSIISNISTTTTTASETQTSSNVILSTTPLTAITTNNGIEESIVGSSAIQTNIMSPSITPQLNSFFNNRMVVISLLATCGGLFIALIITITLFIVTVIFFRRKIRRRENLAIQAAKTISSLENGQDTLMNDKYVYPLSTRIYEVPSYDEIRKSVDSGQASQESYQSLNCTNMEYTTIYSTPNR